MRVALVCPYDLSVPGGVQAHVRDLAEELRRIGDEVLVVAPAEGRMPDGVRGVGGSVTIPFNASRAPIALDPRAARRTVEELRRFRPDVTHVHEPAVPVVSLATSLWGPEPLVGTFHAWSDSDLAYRTVRPVLRRAAARLDARIAVSRPARDYHARALGLPAGSFREIPNGVEVARFADAAPLPELVGSGAPTVLFVGRLEPRKGLEQLVRAFVLLKARRPTVRLLVVGDGPERDRCQALIPVRLRSDVLFIGRVDADDLPRFYASADVFAAPNLGGESFGIVLVEAMSAGVPVVASSIPGFASLLQDGREGRLVPPQDTRELADALDALLDNASLRAAMAEEGRRTAARYDWAVVAAQVRDVYENVLARRVAS